MSRSLWQDGRDVIFVGKQEAVSYIQLYNDSAYNINISNCDDNDNDNGEHGYSIESIR